MAGLGHESGHINERESAIIRNSFSVQVPENQHGHDTPRGGACIARGHDGR